VPIWLTESEYETLKAACSRMIPSTRGYPGASEAGVVDYIDNLLGAFSFDPPRIFAGGPTSGRSGGEARFSEFVALSGLEELAWRIRIEGSMGIAEREFNGPVVGLEERYREGLRSLGREFVSLDEKDMDARLAANEEFTKLLYEHCCEGMYGAPEYGGNRDLLGWSVIGFDGDVQPRGWSDEEVSGPS
jgi:hypothetical protein